MGNIMSRNFIYNIYGFLAWMSLLLICYRLVNQLFVRAQKKWDKRRIQTQYREKGPESWRPLTLPRQVEQDWVGHPRGRGTTQAALEVKSLPAVQQTQVRSLGWEDPLEEGVATHPRIVAWRPHGQRSLACYSPRGHRVGHNWSDLARAHSRGLWLFCRQKAWLWGVWTDIGAGISSIRTKTMPLKGELHSGITLNPKQIF